MRISRRHALFAFSLAALGACKREAPPEPRPRELNVFAAASLREAFTEIGRSFEADHPGVLVVFNFAGTQELRTQLEHGAVADVLASADTRHMDALRQAGVVEAAVELVRNEPVVVVPAIGSTVETFADLPSAKRIVVGTPEVPIGRYTDTILDNVAAATPALAAGIRAHVVSRELNVKQVLAKVTLGEADAGIVYRTDASAIAGKVRIIAIPDDVNVIARYPIAVTTRAAYPELARDFVAFSTSPRGQDALVRQGFLPPSGVASAP